MNNIIMQDDFIIGVAKDLITYLKKEVIDFIVLEDYDNVKVVINILEELEDIKDITSIIKIEVTPMENIRIIQLD